jgi:carbon-monoxide dehydrogenase medium subunit
LPGTENWKLKSMMWKQVISVASAAEAVSLLSEHGTSARIMAGGTDLLIEIERGVRSGIETIIDISRAAGLSDISLDGGYIRLGALVTHNDAVASELIRSRALPLAQACWEVGAPQIRNRATIAGNIITASPANDTISPLLALDSEVELLSVRGVRRIPLSQFYTGLRKTVMEPDELLTAILVRAMQPNERGVFIKLGLRRAQAITVVNVSAILAFDGETVSRAMITLGSVAPTVIRVLDAEAALIGKSLTPEAIADAARIAAATPKPITDVRSTAEYRTEMIAVLLTRALRQIASGAVTSLPQAPAMLWGSTPHVTLDVSAMHAENVPIETTINGQPYVFEAGHDKTLLDFLREDAGLTGSKEGCAEGECGACTVFLDGAAVMACMVPAVRAHGAQVVTVEGLAHDGELHPVQAAFIEHGAVQCGYCTPGFLMAGAKLLDETSDPTIEQIQQTFSGNLCRCTGYYKIISAMQDAAKRRKTAL